MNRCQPSQTALLLVLLGAFGCQPAPDSPVASDCPSCTWFPDDDGDGYGVSPESSASSTCACEAAEGLVAQAGDCDDADPAIHPDAEELCNGLDDDCDGVIDPPQSLDAQDWAVDLDGDGYGDLEAAERACEPPSGEAAPATDCDDDDASVHPGATEVWYTRAGQG